MASSLLGFKNKGEGQEAQCTHREIVAGLQAELVL